MPAEIKTITTPFIFNVSVNCYLVRTDDGYILIDTGRTTKRNTIEKELASAGCRPGNLRLIILTHGDFDHSGNAAFLGQKFGTQIAMHNDDSGIVEHGDMFWNRKKSNILIRLISVLLFKLNKSDRCKPDVYLADGADLSGYGFDAKILSIPGHSKGSIGILTNDGNFFCGDLLANTGIPDLWSIMDDVPSAKASVNKLKGLEIDAVYPGHGKSFTMEALRQTIGN